MGETGLIFGLGTYLARMTKGGKLAIEPDRILALLSVAERRPVSADILRHLEAAAGYWRQGDKALANPRLVFAGLPRLDDPADAQRLRLAETLLDAGLPPRTLMTELDLDPAVLDLAKAGYNPNQARVPAGNGEESGRWEEIWTDIKDWFEQPVSEYDQDTGLQVGTQSRGHAIATNPITVGVAGTAALLASEALLVAAAVEDAVPAAADPAGIAINAARGLASQARVLEDMGLTRNTQSVITAEGRSIPDALTDSLSIEIKDSMYVSRTAQVRIQTSAARASGRTSVLIVGEKTRLSEQARQAFNEIIRRSDLGPR